MGIDLPDWTRQVKLLGIDPDGNLVAVACDADGNIISLIYGTYDSTLKPLLTDWQGRLLIVPYDEKDIWGRSIHVGFGELAARLGSPRRFDRAGNTFAMESFEHGFYDVDAQPASMGVEAVLNSGKAHTGDYSAKLTIGTIAANNGGVEWYVAYPAGTRFGFEASFAFDETFEYYDLHILQYSASRYRLAGLKHDVLNDILYYWADDLSWKELATGVDILHPTAYWHTVKLVFETETEKYVRCMVDAYNYDMSAYSLQASDNVNPPCMAATFRFFPDVGTEANIYIDDLIFTVNEP